MSALRDATNRYNNQPPIQVKRGLKVNAKGLMSL